MSYDTILYSRDDGVAVITLNRPEKLNALNIAMRAETVKALEVAADDDDVNVIVIKGEGRAFCSGYDISPDAEETGWVTGDDGLALSRRYMREYTEQWVRSIWENPKPVIAQVQGYCLAGGFDLVQACDLIVASDDARFGLPEGRFGAVLLGFLPWTIGMRKSKEVLFTTREFTAEEMYDAGLLSRVVPRESLEAEVTEMAKAMARIPFETLYFSKLAINESYEVAGLRSSIRQSYAINSLAHLTDGAIKEWAEIRSTKGVKAALAWRDADWQSSPPE